MSLGDSCNARAYCQWHWPIVNGFGDEIAGNAMWLVSHGFLHEVRLHVSLDLAGGQIPSMKFADLSPIVHAPKHQPDFEGVSKRGTRSGRRQRW